MSENNGARGISPWELAHMYEAPLAAAVLSVDFAQHERQVAESLPEATEGRLAAAEYSLDAAEKKLATLRSTGRAGLSTIEDFPPEDTLLAQMKIDGRPEEAAQTVIANVKALNEYARTENPVIAVVGRLSDRSSDQIETHSWVHFLHPQTDDSEVAASTITHFNGEHYAEVSSGRSYAFNTNVQEYEKVRYDGETASLSVDKPIEDVLFASSPVEVKKIFEGDLDLKALAGDSSEAVIIYGDEAVELFAQLLSEAEGAQGLRPALYGAMLNMGKSYHGPDMSSTTEQDQEQAKRAFYTDVESYIDMAINRLARSNRAQEQKHADNEQFTLLTPAVQSFIGLSDAELAARVQLVVSTNSNVSLKRRNDRVVIIGGSRTTLEEAWSYAWSCLEGKGFGELSERMLKEEVDSISSVA